MIAKQQQFLSLTENALNEMKENQSVLLKRGDLFSGDDNRLYKEMYEEIKEVQHFVQQNGDLNKGYRHLQMNVFMKHESFFMNLFDTRHFPVLFELFEFE